MNYPTETDHEAMGQRQRTEDHGKVIFANVFFFLPSYILHLSTHFEKSRRVRAAVCKYRPGVGKIQISKNPKKIQWTTLGTLVMKI